eukprot:1719067-Heterocapsa_arctica.AAC.1
MWRKVIRCHVGCFFVAKKAGNIGSVVDCRQCNQLHRLPPHSEFAHPGALANLLLSDQWVQYCDREGVDPGGLVEHTRACTVDPHGGGIDLTD